MSRYNGYNGSSVRGQALSGELLKDSRAQGHCSPGKVPNPQKATELCANRDDNDKCDAAGIDYTCCDNATKRPYCYSHLCTACPDGQSLDQKTNACREAKCPALSTNQRRFHIVLSGCGPEGVQNISTCILGCVLCRILGAF